MEPVDQPVVQVFSVGGTEAKGLRIKKNYLLFTHMIKFLIPTLKKKKEKSTY